MKEIQNKTVKKKKQREKRTRQASVCCKRKGGENKINEENKIKEANISLKYSENSIHSILSYSAPSYDVRNYITT